MASNPIVNMFKVKELRSRLFFTLVVLAVFRLGSVLTIPGIDATVLFEYFNNLANQNKNSFASYMDFFVGGAFSNFSIFMLGVMPYISTQIIMQLAVIIFPSLKRAVQEDGGQRKMAAWTRIGTIFVCILQSYAVTVYARSIPNCIVIESHWKFNALAMLAVTTGSMVTVWLGDQITARGIGNGISMMIFAGIVARLPSAIMELVKKVSDGEIQLVFVIVVLLMFLVIIGLVIFEEAGERKIPVHYAKRVVGRKMYGGQSSHLPIKVALGGVLPIIFASSILSIPGTINLFIGLKETDGFWGAFFAAFNTNGWLYILLYFLLIIMFAYFYTTIQYNPVEMANNLKSNNGTVPGIRPGAPTAEYIRNILSRITLIGALFLAVIALVPHIYGAVTGMGRMAVGGTSIIIIVGVALETVKQLESQMMMRHYKGFLD